MEPTHSWGPCCKLSCQHGVHSEGQGLHTRAVPACHTPAHGKYTLLIKSKFSLTFNLDRTEQVDHADVLVSTQTWETSCVHCDSVYIYHAYFNSKM